MFNTVSPRRHLRKLTTSCRSWDRHDDDTKANSNEFYSLELAQTGRVSKTYGRVGADGETRLTEMRPWPNAAQPAAGREPAVRGRARPPASFLGG
ncbi:WGR domain-containing protein [Frigoribacterium endophyticum]|uniref:WGR domain-containing protein n=1 Tax=Frigoribacterium endophyticum TaxID=1522176 RepID=UPI00141E0305